MSNNMYIARSTDKSILEKAENGGAIISILQYALKTGKIDGVVAVRAPNGNRYAGVPTLITKPDELIDTAGSLHCSLPNIPRFVKEYLDGASSMKLAIVGKPCDIRGIIELQKREQIDIDNVTLIGVNCTGTIAPTIAKEMFIKEFKVNPDEVVREDIDDGKLIITLQDGTTKSKSLDKLEAQGYGRRENCRRCVINIPTFADFTGKWGAEEKVGSFIQVCSDKGHILINGAIKNGFIEVEEPDKQSISARKVKDQKEIKRAQKWIDTDLTPLRDLDLSERSEYWMNEFSKCIKCYGCRDACPICFCDECILEANREYVENGVIPPSMLFPMTRLAHIADSCIGCGQCQDACPMEIPLSKIFALLHTELSEIFDYTPGIDVTEKPPLATATDEELTIDDTFLDISKIKSRK